MTRRIPLNRLFFALLVFIFPARVLGAPQGDSLAADPFYTRHLNPFVQVYGLPAAEGGRIVPQGSADVRFVTEAGNESRGDSATGEALTLDGETYRGTLVLRYGAARGMEVGVDVPVVGHAGGIFDDFISGWHDFFNFPNGDRDRVGDNELRYFYSRDGEVRSDLRDDTAGLGDVFVSGAFRLTRPDSPRHAAVRLGVKLPTGDSDRLLGSGSTDVSLRLAGTDSATLAHWNMTLFGEAGIVRLGNGDVMEDLRRRWVGTGNLGFAWSPLDWASVKVQADTHTSVFRGSDFEPIDSWALQLVTGFAFALPGDFLLDAAVSENIVAETAPDVVFHLALRKRF